ncbi:hypothetical protein DY000_02054458 [Brassica cretica]|uniref:Secreted protein n=1 Tax=Brassica cretica TaxID=69181 RepID=A0ABQ7A4Q3_BRACR|nr:hypothetical protein DY000_02054458 [Brassica cretica]
MSWSSVSRVEMQLLLTPFCADFFAWLLRGLAFNKCSVLLMREIVATCVPVWACGRMLLILSSSYSSLSQFLRADHRRGQNYRVTTLVIVVVFPLAASGCVD